jgi:hypothetical protein
VRVHEHWSETLTVKSGYRGGMARRRGNKNWGKMVLDNLPVVPSRFETQVEQLGLTDRPEEWPQSEPLRQWARANRHSYFVPERLLSTWGLIVREDC